MAGHSEWSQVKHIKAVVDIRRGKLFSKLANRFAVVARVGIHHPLQRGSGELEPGAVAILVKVPSEDENRAAANLRLNFSKNHGNLASSGRVAYLFRRKGQITLPRASIDDDRLLELALEVGAEDVTADEEHHLTTTASISYRLLPRRSGLRASAFNRRSSPTSPKIPCN
jgi:transcriptional/translational regulatory protein YebC/TACO1